MDGSLTDFQEKKTTTKGPKDANKPSGSKSKIQKPKKPKSLKGQKDIRTALKLKKNALLSYTKEFDDVCKKSGIDVDSEQLQLAIALSKSLQESEVADECSSQCSLTSKERSVKIRTTLQEYGFTVPETKITKRKGVYKNRKHYKLITKSDTEKQQIISDKFSQVLFEISCYSNSNDDHNSSDYSDKKLYYVATNIKYYEMCDNDVLYVENLLEKSTSSGNLLRDWCNIPGRPASPKKTENINMNISEIECSQEELDVILSGSLKAAKDIIKCKCTVTRSILKDEDNAKETELYIPNEIQGNFKESAKNTILKHAEEQLSTNSKDVKRSSSPDMFDDEGSMLDTSEVNKDIIYSQLISSITEDQCDPTDIINLEEPDNLIINNINLVDTVTVLHNSNQLDTSNTTKISANDYMEETNCVVNNIHLHSSNIVLNKDSNSCTSYNKSITHQPHDITHGIRRLSNEDMEITECVANSADIPDKIDLTQSSEENIVVDSYTNLDSKQKMQINIATDIDLTPPSHERKRTKDPEKEFTKDVLNLSQISSSGDELPSIQIAGNSKQFLNQCDDTIILDDDEINAPSFKSAKALEIELFRHSDNDKIMPANLNLEITSHEKSLNASQNFFDEFIHNHSDDNNKGDIQSLENNYDGDKVDLTQSSDENNDCDKIDLTQSLDVSNVSNKDENNTNIKVANKEIDLDIVDNKLGKKDNVSIDYDDLYDDVVEKSKDTHSSFNNASQQSNDSEINNSSQSSNRNSGLFELCDPELNYSLNKSRQNRGWDNFGGISVMDDVSGSEKFENSDSELVNKNSTTPITVKHVRNNDDNVDKNHLGDAHCKHLTNNPIAVTDTPTNNYIIKIGQVTPMLDYASMSTPERNRELDKYGLKPFKRKRAIQLLTHLYNQTHPILEPCTEEASPSKKPKRSQPSVSQKTMISAPSIEMPKNLSSTPSPSETPVVSNKENLYKMTQEQPDIRLIEGLEEDLVFQKREKAKVHSCRVPLHIVFHNYVSCRQRLREAILRYEPVNIDVIHKDLVAQGYRYDPKDLLKFLDKKCITVKTADNAARNKRI